MEIEEYREKIKEAVDSLKNPETLVLIYELTGRMVKDEREN